jgi:hypothetical protein
MENSSYRYTRWDLPHSFMLVPITKLVLDASIVEELEKRKVKHDKYKQKIYNNVNKPLPLTRMVNTIPNLYRSPSIINAMYEREYFPLVDLRLSLEYPEHYEIMNGRHRVTSSIILEYTHIPCRVYYARYWSPEIEI